MATKGHRVWKKDIETKTSMSKSPHCLPEKPGPQKGADRVGKLFAVRCSGSDKKKKKHNFKRDTRISRFPSLPGERIHCPSAAGSMKNAEWNGKCMPKMRSSGCDSFWPGKQMQCYPFVTNATKNYVVLDTATATKRFYKIKLMSFFRRFIIMCAVVCVRFCDCNGCNDKYL